MKKQIISANSRERATRAAIGSVRCEGLRPSVNTRKHLQNYSTGKMTAAKLHECVMGEVKSILAKV